MELTLSVNQALAQLDVLNGKDIRVQCILSFDFEEVCVSHFSVAERHDNPRSSIWLAVGSGAMGFDKEVCRSLHGKRVVVEGTFSAASATMGCGHMGMWPAELLARSLDRA